MNHIFVDFENVHEIDLSIIGTKSVSFTLLLGARQTKLDAALVEKLLQHAASVQLIRLTSAGKNALDFTLAYYVGRAAVTDPVGYFHIISRDTGYDPLIEHLRRHHIRAYRHDDFASLLFSAVPKPVASPPAPRPPTPKILAVAKAKSPATPKLPAAPKPPAAAKPLALPRLTALQAEDPFVRFLEHLRKHPDNRPKSKKTLHSHLLALAGKTATATQITVLIDKLHTAGHIALNDKDAVTYPE